MNHEESHKLAEPPDASSAGAQAEQWTPESAAREETASPLPRVEYSESAVAAVRQTEICQEEEKAVPLPQFDNPETTEAEQQQIGRDETIVVSCSRTGIQWVDFIRRCGACPGTESEQLLQGTKSADDRSSSSYSASLDTP